MIEMTLAVWGRARYLSVTEAPHNTDFHTWIGKKHFLFLWNRRAPNSGVKGSGANHYPRAPAHAYKYSASVANFERMSNTFIRKHIRKHIRLCVRAA